MLKTRLLAAAIFVTSAAVFWPALKLPFLHWDDAQNIIENPLLRFDAPGLSWMLTGSKLGHWQPSTWLSLALDRAVWGGNPLGYHLTNLLLHACNAVLVFLLARRLRLGGAPRLGGGERCQSAAVYAALFWALHPLRVESVAWVTERRDVLCGAFALAAALAYTHGRRPSPWARRCALILSALAMTAKVFAVVLPAVWLVLDLRLEGAAAHPLGAARWRAKLRYLPIVFVALVMNIGAQADSGAAVTWARFGLGPRLAQSFFNLAFYPWKTLCPAGLAPLYEISIRLQPEPFTLAASTVVTAAVLVWLARRRAPGLGQAALAYALLLLPALGLFKSGRMVAADRWSYLPAIPLSLLAAGALTRVFSAMPARALATTVAVVLAVLTRRQIPIWSSDEALWERARAASPLSYFAIERQAEAAQRAGHTAAAASLFAEAKLLRRIVLERAADARAK